MIYEEFTLNQCQWHDCYNGTNFAVDTPTGITPYCEEHIEYFPFPRKPSVKIYNATPAMIYNFTYAGKRYKIVTGEFGEGTITDSDGGTYTLMGYNWLRIQDESNQEEVFAALTKAIYYTLDEVNKDELSNISAR